jgi:AcrR family transcriptional regulator
MPRPVRFTFEDLIRASVRVCLRYGPGGLTMSAVAEEAGAPTGSLYHRFSSRENLLAAAWVSTMAAFQPGFIAALGERSDPPGLAAALYAVRWARANPDAARLLVLYRRQDFVREALPEQLRQTAAELARGFDQAISEFALRAFGSESLAAKQRSSFLLIDLPNAAMRRYLAAGISPPQDVDELVAEAVTAMATTPSASD